MDSIVTHTVANCIMYESIPCEVIPQVDPHEFNFSKTNWSQAPLFNPETESNAPSQNQVLNNGKNFSILSDC